ncbi:MAG: Asp-tRNA(Asn)/Glu-tRNA(Gln) amidotransferase subunit GatC [Candidatus Omnitrophota bacterium]
MAINKDTVKYISDLSRVGLNEKEIEGFTIQLDRILEYIHQLKKVDISNLEPTSHALKMKNIYRDDVVKKSLDIKEVMKNASSEEKGLFKVNKIIDAQ